MENLKLISVRLDKRVIDRLEMLVRKHSYWKRNTFINGILLAVCQCASEQTIYDMIRTWDAKLDDYTVEMKLKTEDQQKKE